MSPLIRSPSRTTSPTAWRNDQLASWASANGLVRVPPSRAARSRTLSASAGASASSKAATASVARSHSLKLASSSSSASSVFLATCKVASGSTAMCMVGCYRTSAPESLGKPRIPSHHMRRLVSRGRQLMGSERVGGMVPSPRIGRMYQVLCSVCGKCQTSLM